MSGLLSARAVMDRTAAALSEWARTDGRSYDDSAGILGIGHASVHRRVNGNTEWTLKDFVHAVCHAEHVDDDPRMLDQLIADVRTCETASGMAAVRHATEVIGAMGGAIQALMQRIADQRMDVDEAKQTYADIARMTSQLDALSAACLALTEGRR